MSLIESIFRGFEYFVLAYFSVLALMYALWGYIGLRVIIVYSRELSKTALMDLLHREYYEAVSILIPAFNEELTIVASIKSMLKLEHPDFEVIVANDGSTDRTLDVMIAAFAFAEVPVAHSQPVRTEPVRRVFRSLRYPNLTVVDKVNGGQADAINAALNTARNPLVCVVDADSALDSQALVRASRLFVEDESVVAVGGTLRPLNGAVVRDGHVLELRAPKRWAERIQVLEYARAFFANRAAWSRFNALPIISGAFGLFRRSATLEVGGWWPGTVANDMDITLKLHRYAREHGRPCRIVFTPDPICWTEVPSTFLGLARQRHGWARGLIEVLWRHRRMLFNPRYGRLGMFSIPYLWFFEAFAVIVETLGYAYIFASWALGLLNPTFALLFLALAILYGIMLSELAMGIETLLLSRYSRPRDRAVLFAASVVEHLGLRQILLLVRFVATFQVRSHRGRWWRLERQGYLNGSEPIESGEKASAKVA